MLIGVNLGIYLRPVLTARRSELSEKNAVIFP
jgi:hypothetical protein